MMTKKQVALSALLMAAAVFYTANDLALQAAAPAEAQKREILASAADATELEQDSITVLGGPAIDRYQGDCSSEVSGRWVDFTGDGKVAWNVQAGGSGRYEVVVAYASLSASGAFTVAASESTVRGNVAETLGLYDNTKKHPKNFERHLLAGVLNVPEGRSSVCFRLAAGESGAPFRLGLIELIPVDHKRAILRQQAEAQRRRASTDWFVDAKYGVMFHWTTESLPLEGELKSYSEAVRDFDVNAFAEMVEQTGARYVFFTAMHAEPTFPAPIEAWEHAFPGMTTRRDLIMEIADALRARQIKLGLYLASGPMAKDLTSSNRQHLDEQDYSARVFALFTSIGERYGEKVFAYWIDNWGTVDKWYPTFDYERYFEALKAGNPDRLIGLNSNIEVSVTPWQEYWAGEANGDPKAPPGGRYYRRGPAKGLQRHGLIHLETQWIHAVRKMKPTDPRYALIGKQNIPIEPPMYTAERLVGFVHGFNENAGVVTINIKISQEGRISDAALELMAKLRRRARQK